MSTTVSQLLTYVENKTQAGTGTLNSATVGVPFLNEAMLDLRSELIDNDVDASQTQESYVAIVTIPMYPNTSTFAYPSDMYVLKTIEVNMSTTNQQDYVQATQIEVSNTPFNTSFDWLRVNQSRQTPLFDDRGDTYEIFPTFATGMNLTNAIKIIYFLQPTPYGIGDTLVYPDTLDIYILADRVAALYYESLNKFNEADSWRGKSDKRMKKLIKSLAKGSQQPIEPTNSYPTGFEY